MKPSIVAPFAAVLALTQSASAQIQVSDTWTDGSRNEQNLPGESAWYAASSSTLSASAGSLTGTVGSGSSLWLTYFTPVGTPAALGVGDTLRIETEVHAMRESASRPAAGIVTFLHRSWNQRKEEVASC